MQNILFLDIETVPLTYRYESLDETYKKLWDAKWKNQKEGKPEDAYSKAGIYAEFAKVISIGLGFFHEDKFRVTCYSGHDEKKILSDFCELLKKFFFDENKHSLCAHNGKEFDFPFLCRRMLINTLPLPKLLQIQGKKPWEIKHLLDTMELWKFGDIKNYTSLDLLAHVMGIPSPKSDMDGSMVSKVYYEENNLQKINTYCMKDVATLARVYARFLGKGDISDEQIIFT